MIQREGGQTLFDFDYQVECYVPEAKRRFGYFCLPILYHDRLIGRMDCKAHRKEGRLDVGTLHLEDARLVARADPSLANNVADALGAFANFNQCAEVNLLTVFPKHWHTTLNNALAVRTQPSI